MDRRSLLRLCAAFMAAVAGPGALGSDSASNFRRIYDDPLLRDRFFLFLQNVFHLYPEAAFHQAIIDLCEAHDDDHVIYEALQGRLNAIEPFGATLTYALPALKVQKQEMARQSAKLLADVPRIDGYVEIGTTGRYVGSLRGVLPLTGLVTLVNDVAPGFGPADIIERGQLRRAGTFVPLGNYDPLPEGALADESVDLVTSFIGLHHCPPERLTGFVASLHRVLRPGGRLLLREHDVVDATMNTFVALAHDVFNAGVSLDWAENAQQVRAFRSVQDWTALLAGAGFARVPGDARQAHDPTDNALLVFVRA